MADVYFDRIRNCEITIETMYRLNKEQYDQLVRQLPKPIPSENTTDIQAGYLLGIQFVLDKLREGYVIEDNRS